MILRFLIDFTVTGKKLLAELPLAELPLPELPLDPRLSSGVLVDVFVAFDAVGLGGSDSGTSSGTMGGADTLGGATDTLGAA